MIFLFAASDVGVACMCVFQMQSKIEDLESQLQQSNQRLDILTREKEEVSHWLPSLCLLTQCLQSAVCTTFHLAVNLTDMLTN